MNVGGKHVAADRMIAGVISLALVISAVGFIYIASAMKTSHGIASAAIDMALLFYVIADTDIPQKIRESPAMKRQLLIWSGWLMILGVTPAIDPSTIRPLVLALVTGLFMSALSIAALFFRNQDERH